MGDFLNPSNSAFKEIVNAKIYVDKSGLISLTNDVISSPQKFICNSRPRRFGKSTTANMLSAYYGKENDSKELFSHLDISKDPSFEKYLNKFDVIYFDVQDCLSRCGNVDQTVSFIENRCMSELKQLYSSINFDSVNKLVDAMGKINIETNNQFVVIIDEWDMLIREDSNNKKIQDEYISFLRGLFKTSTANRSVALAYLTGILPIKIYHTESSMNNFDEYTMLNPSSFSPFIGFTDKEVKSLCERYSQNFDKVKEWYDGYILNGEHVYNPRAVVSLMLQGNYQNYWSDTGAYENIIPYLDMNYNGLHQAMIQLVSGEKVDVNVSTFKNDIINIKTRDQVLTYLIHLGYLAYQDGKAFVPNKEIKQVLINAIEETDADDYIKYGIQSKKLLEATLNEESNVVSNILENIHIRYSSMITYNNENSLASVITIAYLYSMKYYYDPIRELPSGKGYADLVYIPKKEYVNDLPALIIELKWNKDVDTAMNQIKEKKYPESLTQYTGNILLVAINYDKKTKEHQCKIETLEK